MNNLIKTLIATTFLVSAMATQAAPVTCPDPLVTGWGNITVDTSPDSACVGYGAGDVDLDPLVLLDKTGEGDNLLEGALIITGGPSSGGFEITGVDGYTNLQLVIKDGNLDGGNPTEFQWGAFLLGALSGTWSIEGPNSEQIKAISGAELWGSATVVPVPAAVWLFGTALLGFVGISRRTTIRS